MKLLIIFFLFLPIIGYCQEANSSYNFDFEQDLNTDCDGWQGVFDSFAFNYDTTNKTQGKRSLVFTRQYLKMEFNLCLYRKILLPKPSKDILVSVSSRSLLLQSSWLKICGFNKNGKIVVSDSISMLSENEWQKFTARLNGQDLYLISIELRARENFQEKKKEVKFWLDDINVVCDGIDLLLIAQNMEKAGKRELEQMKANIQLNDSFCLPDFILKSIAAKKVIGFGETVHGSLESDKFLYENIRLLIKNYGCRLVFFEMSIDQVAKHNLFIQGYEVDTTFSKLVFLSKEYEKFIHWLKEYNSNHDEKVNIVGIDLHSNQFASDTWNAFRHINSYLVSLDLNIKPIDFIRYLVNNESRIAPLEYLKRYESEIRGTINDLNFIVLRQILKSRTDTALVVPKLKTNFYYWQPVHRDYTLWLNTKAVLDEFWDGNSPVVICSHYGHLDKVTSIHFNEVTNLGQYLNERFGKDYYHLGIILGEGLAGATRNGNAVYNNLQYPISGSIENLAMQTSQSCFFKDGYISSKMPFTIRRMGNVMTKCQFIPSYFQDSMDGFVFIKKSSPSFLQYEILE